MKSTTQATFKKDVLEADKVVLLDVWAPWCAPCRGMNPILEKLSEEQKAVMDLVKLDASTEESLVQELGVTGLPTFLVFKKGQIVGQAIGATSKANLESLVLKAA